MTGFDKQALLNLMSYPNDISDKELEELNEILATYPYFQLGHSLVAKAKHDKQTVDAHQALTHAAIYAPNRSLLRSLFYEDLKIDYASPGITEEEEVSDNLTTEDEDTFSTYENAEAVDTGKEDTLVSTPENYDPLLNEEEADVDQEQVIESDEVYNELEENLRKLRESKNQFTEDSEEEDKKKITDQTDLPPTSSQTSEKSSDVAPLLMDLVEEDTHSPAVGNQEQNELIERFINFEKKGRIQIKASGQESTDPNDLSLQSVNINDDLITENLAEIYLHQGKKEKAIEIYHKLIWKFPQKKAYFAEIIENLKAE